MALIKCPDCGEKVSDKASACIHCGCPINKKNETVHYNKRTIKKISDKIFEECEKSRKEKEVRFPFPLIWHI